MLIARSLLRDQRSCRPLKPSFQSKYATRSFEPLRILFCGSDAFSIASLDALHDASQQDPSFIESIEVISRPGKWNGPYRKVFKEVPIAERARTLKLPIHQVDTFRGWTPPSRNPSNLIIAVSFGLFIPRRLIENAKYGGLNVHPSMLPDLWGAAPLQHALLDNDSHAGITIQTLHPTTMDKGMILAQTTKPGLQIPNAVKDSFNSFTSYMAPKGAETLVRTLREGRFTDPAGPTSAAETSGIQGPPTRHAYKLSIEDRHIDWTHWPCDKILRYQKLLGTLWNNIKMVSTPVKIVWSGRFEISEGPGINTSIAPGIAYMAGDDGVLHVNTADGRTLQVRECTVAGDRARGVSQVARRYGLIDEGDGLAATFRAPFD